MIPSAFLDRFDSTKLEDYEVCPRKFYLRHRRGWTLGAARLDLVHGSAFHAGMQVLYKSKGHGSYSEALEEANAAYLSEYAKVYSDDADVWEANSPKNPAGAAVAYSEFCRQAEGDSFRVVGAEICGAYPVSSRNAVLVKLDCIIEGSDGLVYVVEHKTSGRRLNSLYVDEKAMSIQFHSQAVLGMSYAMSIGNVDAFAGVLVNHFAFLRKGRSIQVELQRFVVKKESFQLLPFLREVNQLIDNIRRADQISDVTAAYPRRLTSCVRYFRRCQFYDICRFASEIPERPPAGFIESWWDPENTEDK